MRNLMIAALALLAAACTSMPPQPQKPQPIAAHSASGLVGFATLASFGTFEMESAPTYTRLAVLRHNAARALDKGRIPVAVAVAIQAGADEVRTKLTLATLLDAQKDSAGAKAKLDEAIRDIEQLERKLP